jgi:hypothetical protein
MIGPVRDFLGHREFHAGLAAGVGLAALGLAIALLASERRRGIVPVGGLLVAVGFVAGVRRAPHLSNRIALGLLLLAAAGFAAGWLARRRPALRFVGLALAAPGAIVLATHHGVPPVHADNQAAWIAPLIALSIVVGGPLVADFDRRFAPRGWPMVLYAISVVGVFFTVPDTERALVLLGVSLPLMFLGWPFAIASLGSAGSYAAVGVLVWVSATEGRGRHTAIIGGIACLGLLVVEPAARLLRGGRATVFEGLSTSRWMLLPIATLHLALVYIASRVAGIRRVLGPAVAIVVIELAIAIVVLSRPDPPFGTVFDDGDKIER